MINPVLKWALRILQQSEETSASESVFRALGLVGIDQIQVNSQPLESIFSAVPLNNEPSSIVQKKISWQALDAQKIVYPTEHVNDVTLHIPEPPGGWDRFHANENLALAFIEKYGMFLSISPCVSHLSFYDAVKSASAIHDCLERGQTDEPFLLVSGDFSGIQEAIYTIASSGALKTLRARSFMLDLLTEHIIYEIQQATGCDRHSVIFSGGGGFSLLVPNTEGSQSVIDAFAEVINEWILEQFGFQLFLALHCEPLSIDALESSQFRDTWELIADALGKQKQRKFWKNNNLENLFCPTIPKQLSNQAACQITHRDDLPNSEMTDLEGVGRVSKLAYRLWRLGDRLTEFDCILRLPRLSSRADSFRDGTLLFPTHQRQSAEYKVCLRSQVGDYDARWLVNNWELGNYDENTFPILFANYVRSVADLPPDARTHEKEEYQRDYGKELKNPKGTTASFSGLAKAAQGSELIGCLRMDVDNSGELFSAGQFSLGLGIAVSSNLSRSMNLFFKGYLNEICSMKLGDLTETNHPIDITGEKASKTKGRDVSIVYAGGDDLFIAGAWDDVAELAFDIYSCFREFSCWHPDVHLSSGVTLHKPKFPLYQMAHMAKRSEDAAKRNERQMNGETEDKNSLSLFFSDDLKRRNTSLNERIREENQSHGWSQKSNRIAVASQWDEYDDVVQLTKQLHKVYQHPDLSHAFYRKLFETLKIWQEQGQLYMPMMFHALRQLDRIQPQTSELAELKRLLFRQDYMRKLHIPLNWVEYLNRQSEGGN